MALPVSQQLTLHCCVLVCSVVGDAAAEAGEHGKLFLLEGAQQAGHLLLLLTALHVVRLERGQYLIRRPTQHITRLHSPGREGGRERGRAGRVEGKEGGRERRDKEIHI